jgi:phospholipid/cholesterol/gamma-HCH transport system substrate-binding protein
MDNKINHALVGLLVIILSLALVASTLWLSVGTDKKNYQTYQAFIKESVSGLNWKAPVKYRGVEVGYVRDITLIADRPHEVRVLLDIQQGVPLKQDTLVVLSTQGLTGLAYIELTGGTLTAPLPIRQPGQHYPELTTKPSLLVRLDTAISNLLIQLENVSAKANDLLKSFNPATSSDLFANINQLSRSITALLSEQNVAAVTNTLHNLDLISTSLTARTPQLESGLANIEKTASQLGLALTESSRDMNYFTHQVLPEINSSLQELHVLSTTLRNFTQELERNPNMLLFGKSEPPLGPGE